MHILQEPDSQLMSVTHVQSAEDGGRGEEIYQVAL